MNAPPRRILAPARLTAAAVASTCSSDSAEHGPAMTMTSSPPIRTSPIETIGVLGLEGAAGELVGLGDPQHFVHALLNREQLRIAVALPDGADHGARSHRSIGCTSNPISISCAMTASIWASRRALFHHNNHDRLLDLTIDAARSLRQPDRLTSAALSSATSRTVRRRAPAGGPRPTASAITCTIALPTTAASANALTSRHVLGPADAEPERDRQRRELPDARARAARRIRDGVPRARHAQPRNRIQESAAQPRRPPPAAHRSSSG